MFRILVDVFLTQRRVDLLADLLEMGAGIYARDIVGNNALHSAASSGCVSAAELLISAGASVNRVRLRSLRSNSNAGAMSFSRSRKKHTFCILFNDAQWRIQDFPDRAKTYYLTRFLYVPIEGQFVQQVQWQIQEEQFLAYIFPLGWWPSTPCGKPWIHH